MEIQRFNLFPEIFKENERLLFSDRDFRVGVFRYDTGVDAIRIANSRGELIILPFMGQILWDATFDGVKLGMDSMFDKPRKASTILGTYGCLHYHAGLLRNGVPGPDDDHPLHGELPCAAMDASWLEVGGEGDAAYVRLVSEFNYAQGFGDNYLARPSVTLFAGRTTFEIGLDAQNMSSAPMDVMYLSHLNFAFCEGARIVQPAPFSPERTAVRTDIPSHVAATPDYRRLVERLAANPGEMMVLDDIGRFNPEQVFYIKRPETGPDGCATFLMKRVEGDGFLVSFDPVVFSHTVRWLYHSGAQRVAAFALPATCQPEGYAAEKRNGNVRSLAGGERVRFRVTAGYVDRQSAVDIESQILRTIR